MEAIISHSPFLYMSEPPFHTETSAALLNTGCLNPLGTIQRQSIRTLNLSVNQSIVHKALTMQAPIAMGGFDVEVLYLTLEPARHCLSLSHCDEVRSETGNP